MRHTVIFTGFVVGLLLWQLFNGAHPLLSFAMGFVLGLEIMFLIDDAQRIKRE